MINIPEIINAWRIAKSPTPEQQRLAEERLAVCATCEYRGTNVIWSTQVCSLCGCPLDKKAFSNKTSCPMNYWKK